MREFFTIAIFKIKADIRMNKTTLNNQKEKHSIANFYPRPPCGERREYLLVVIVGYHNFYPRSPCGERHHIPAAHVQLSIFLSTLSLRRATGFASFILNPAIFLSTLSLRRATCFGLAVLITIIFLSTLSLRRATGSVHHFPRRLPISIHALLAESDQSFFQQAADITRFLSTLSLRRATTRFWNFLLTMIIFLSTLSLRRATCWNSQREHG